MDPVPEAQVVSSMGPGARAAWVAGLVALVSLVTAVGGPFTVDEANHVAAVAGLRHGDWALPGTAGLPPALDLFSFDPAPTARRELQPVVSSAPALYPFLAWPFSFFGYRGLVALNALAFGALVLLAFHHARRRSGSDTGGWAAVWLVVAGCSLPEYAGGAWPHVATVALTFGAFVLASRAVEGADVRAALLAGLAAGVASGVRYQNAVFAALLGFSLLLAGPARLRLFVAYVAGTLPAVALASVVNAARLGTWHPFSKFEGYTTLPGLEQLVVGTARRDELGWLPAPLHVLWAKVVDFSSHPKMGGARPGEWAWVPDVNGVFSWSGSVKLAWLQSSPWIVAALGLGVVVAMRRGEEAARTWDARAMLVVVGGMLGFFAVAGFGRFDGFSFNQRYFLELGPPCALVLATVAAPVLSRRLLVIGASIAVVLGLVLVVLGPGDAVRTGLLQAVPWLLVAALGWALAEVPRRGPGVALVIGAAALAWSGTVHLLNDVRGSRLMRGANAAQHARLLDVVRPGDALLAFGPASDPANLLVLEREVVVVDPLESAASETGPVIQALQARGTRVLVDLASFPPEIWDRVRAGSRVVVVRDGEDPIVELAAP